MTEKGDANPDSGLSLLVLHLPRAFQRPASVHASSASPRRSRELQNAFSGDPYSPADVSSVNLRGPRILSPFYRLGSRGCRNQLQKEQWSSPYGVRENWDEMPSNGPNGILVSARSCEEYAVPLHATRIPSFTDTGSCETRQFGASYALKALFSLEALQQQEGTEYVYVRVRASEARLPTSSCVR